MTTPTDLLIESPEKKKRWEEIKKSSIFLFLKQLIYTLAGVVLKYILERLVFI